MVQAEIPAHFTGNASDVEARCELSKTFERTGNIPGAATVLGDYWQGVGIKPNIENLPLTTAAEVLLRVGVLTSWLEGTSSGLNGQQTAESIITEALSLYIHLDLTSKIAEAQVELAECCRRNNRLPAARALLFSALELIDSDCDLKGWAILRLANTELTIGRTADALALLDGSPTLFTASREPALTGKYYSSLLAALMILAESRPTNDDLLGRIFISGAAARRFYQQSDNTQAIAVVENNLGLAYYLKGNYAEALKQLDIAHETFTKLNMRSMMAHVDESRARVLLALDNARDAEVYIASAVTVMDEGREQWALSSALITYGRVLACLKRFDDAAAKFTRARDIAESTGNVEGVKAVDDAIADCMPNKSNVVCIETRRKTFDWGICDDSMTEAGLREGRYYKFRATSRWKDGDIVAVETECGKYIAFISNACSGGVWLKWSNASVVPRWFASVTVHGVLRRRKR